MKKRLWEVLAEYIKNMYPNDSLPKEFRIAQSDYERINQQEDCPRDSEFTWLRTDGHEVKIIPSIYVESILPKDPNTKPLPYDLSTLTELK